jgi:hypothetical protein
VVAEEYLNLIFHLCHDLVALGHLRVGRIATVSCRCKRAAGATDLSALVG